VRSRLRRLFRRLNVDEVPVRACIRGGVAIIRVGAATEAEVAMRGALHDGLRAGELHIGIEPITYPVITNHDSENNANESPI
jgi:hypothetical protein